MISPGTSLQRVNHVATRVARHGKAIVWGKAPEEVAWPWHSGIVHVTNVDRHKKE